MIQMIEIHVYGFLMKKFDQNARISTVIQIPSVTDERFSDLLVRLNVDTNEIGDCFVNHKLVVNENEVQIPDGARVALFSRGMHLIDGGQYIKGHGYVTKKPPKKIDFW